MHGPRLLCFVLCAAQLRLCGGVFPAVDTVKTSQYPGTNPLELRGVLDMRPEYDRFDLSSSMYEGLVLFAQWANTVHGGVHLGGETRPLNLVTYEAASSEAAMEATAVRLAQRSLELQTDAFYYAPYGSAMSEVVASVTERGQSLLVAGASSATSVFKARRRVFGTLSPGELRFVGSVRVFREKGANSTVCFTSVANGANGVERCRRALNEAKQLGMRCDGVRVVPKNVSAAAEMMRNARFGGVWDSDVNTTGEPDLVLADFGEAEVAMFILIAKQLDWNVKAIVTTQETDVPDGFDGDYISYTTPWHAQLEQSSSGAGRSEQFGPTPSEFDAMYRMRWLRQPEYQAASAFATGAVLLRAIESCGCTDPDGVAAALVRLRLYTSYGLVQFDENRQNMGVYHTRQRVPRVGNAEQTRDGGNIVFPAPTWKRRSCELLSDLRQNKCGGLGLCQDDGACLCNTASARPSPDGGCLPLVPPCAAGSARGDLTSECEPCPPGALP